MRVLILCPHGPDEITGNSISAGRFAKGLRRRGHDVRVAAAGDEATAESVRREIDGSAPDVVHWIHGYRTGRFLPAARARPGAAHVLTLTGTDLHHHTASPASAAVVRAAIERAHAVCTAAPSMREKARALFGGLGDRVRVIPKGVEVGRAAYPLPVRGKDAVLLLAGGLRPVKNQLFAVEAAADLGDVRLLVVGPELDPDYAARVNAAALSRPGARILGPVSHPAMGAFYRRADVVLNTSLSEALANTVIEALTVGRAVLASDIPGNRDLIRDGATGLLYRDRADFVEKARRLLADADLRRVLGDRARAFAEATFSADRESDALVAVYRDALEAARA